MSMLEDFRVVRKWAGGFDGFRQKQGTMFTQV
jgi:hypothetical protein